MIKITAEQKCEYREALAQAQAGVDRLNELFADTARPLLASLRIHNLRSSDQDDYEDDVADQDDSLELDRCVDRIGSEHAESEEGNEI
jgi:hypothetical protein